MRNIYGIQGNPTGKIIHHNLKKDGTITYYDMDFKGTICRKVPASLVESVSEQQHEHESRD